MLTSVLLSWLPACFCKMKNFPFMLFVIPNTSRNILCGFYELLTINQGRTVREVGSTWSQLNNCRQRLPQRLMIVEFSTYLGLISQYGTFVEDATQRRGCHQFEHSELHEVDNIRLKSEATTDGQHSIVLVIGCKPITSNVHRSCLARGATGYCVSRSLS